MSSGSCWTEVKRANSVWPLTRKVGDVVLAVDEDDEEELGSRRTRKMLEPNFPSQAEQEEHSLMHFPYRNWCRHCVRGRAEEHGHFHHGDMPSGVERHLDYCVLGEEDQDFKLTILVARDRGTKMTTSTVAPSKTCDKLIAKRVVAFMKEIGADQVDITIKSDQEPALIALVREIGSHREAGGGGRMVVESSPVGHSHGMVLSRERSSQCRDKFEC